MAWISRRTIKWVTPSARNIWWFRSELKKYLKGKSIDQINFNANTWKWLFDFFDYLWNYRRSWNASVAALHHTYTRANASGNMTQEANDNEVEMRRSFQSFVIYASQRLLGIKLIPSWNQERIYPDFLMKGVRDAHNGLRWMPIPTYEEYKLVGEIQWCSHNKDWYFQSAFSTVYTLVDQNGMRGKEVRTMRVAAAKYFSCPICQQVYHDHSANKFKHKTNRSQTVCFKCVNIEITNKPHTTVSIYGDYHSHYRTGWKFFPCLAPRDDTVPMGIELEMQSKNSLTGWNAPSTAWQMYQHQLKADPKWNYFYCERDGSIGEYGLEMVTQPMTQKLHYKFWNHMLPEIREHFTGWNTEKVHPNSQYGIHITFDSKLYGQLNVARLLKFVENKDNQVFIQGLAQRGLIYGSGVPIAFETKKISESVDINKGKMVGSKSRASNVNLKAGGLCEIRMFRSTLNTVSFYKNLEFLWAFHRWCGETPFQFKADQFISWLLDQPILYHTFPNLYEYMCHRKFPVKLAKWSVENPWKKEFDAIVLQQKKGQKDLFLTEVEPDPVDYV